jgi:ATP-dependent DNA helicase RecG
VRITWFSDRIEILSPGGPFGQVTIGNFGTPGITDYRNRHLAEVLHQLGFVQRFGVGITIARNAMEKNGNPPPEFARTPTHVQVTFRRPA